MNCGDVPEGRDKPRSWPLSCDLRPLVPCAYLQRAARDGTVELNEEEEDLQPCFPSVTATADLVAYNRGLDSYRRTAITPMPKIPSSWSATPLPLRANAANPGL